MNKTWAPRIGAGILLATTALVAVAPTSAIAQAAASVTFDIPASDGATALNAFSRQAGVQLMFPYDIAARHRTAALKGAYGREEALRRLIDGAGLEVASANAQVITLRARSGAPLAGAEPLRWSRRSSSPRAPVRTPAPAWRPATPSPA